MRTILYCPECGDTAKLPLTPPVWPNEIYVCMNCGARTPFDELEDRRSFLQTHGLVGIDTTPRLVQILQATARGTPFYTDPVPGQGSIAEIQANTAAGTRDGSDSTYDAATLTVTGSKASGTYFVPYTLDQCTWGGTIVGLRYRLRAKIAGAANGIAPIQVDAPVSLPGGALVLNAPADQATFDWQEFSSNNQMFSVNSITGLPWDSTTINSMTWFIEVPLQVSSGGPTTLTGYLSDFRLEVWGY